MKCLMLCAGHARREGWKTLDADSSTKPDFWARIPPLPADLWMEAAWDEIEMVHGITSMYPWQARELLKEIKIVLKPDGRLTLEQPNAEIALASGRIEWIFGDPSYENPFIMNRWAYTPGALSNLLSHAGFTRLEVLPAQHHVPERDFRIEARP